MKITENKSKGLSKSFNITVPVDEFQAEYKAKLKGKLLIKVDKWYPSSQLCHCCGCREPLLKDLRIRKWECSCCGTFHDRDTNAAINILHEGLRILKEAA